MHIVRKMDIHVILVSLETSNSRNTTVAEAALDLSKSVNAKQTIVSAP